MREDQVRSEVASHLSAATATLPTSALGRPVRLIAGLTEASTRSLGRALRRRIGRRQPDLRPETAVVTSLGRLKGVPMKMGQLLGYVEVGMPENLRAALSALHTHAQPLPVDRLRAVLDADLGAAGQALARALQPEPISVASLGQVHRSTLPDGTPVAVKVAYPGILATIGRDFAPATLTSRLASWIYPRAHLDTFVRQVRERLLEECDYALEARRQGRFAALFAKHPLILVPAVHHAYCSARVLTTTFVEGIHLEAYLASDPSPEQRNRAGEALFDFYLGALFRHGLYNCDPHPGNYLFTKEGRLALVDFGCTREFEPGFVGRLASLTHALFVDDRELIYRALADLGIAADRERYDHDSTRWLLRAFYGPMLRDEVASFDLRTGLTLRELLRRWRRARGLALSGELFFLLRTLLGLAAVLKRLDARANWYRRLQGALEAPAAGAAAALVPPATTVTTQRPHAAKVTRAETPAAIAVTPDQAAEPGTYDLVLLDAGPSLITVVREIRELTGMDLREVKYLIDATPQTLKQSVTLAEAETLRQRLETAGARVEVRPTAPISQHSG